MNNEEIIKFFEDLKKLSLEIIFTDFFFDKFEESFNFINEFEQNIYNIFLNVIN